MKESTLLQVQVTSDGLGLTDLQDGVRYKYKHDGSVHYNTENLLPFGVDNTEYYTVSPLSGEASGPTRIVRKLDINHNNADICPKRRFSCFIK